MSLFKESNGKLVLIKEKKIDLEATIQKLTEDNLENVFNLKFVSSQLSLHNFRIDTLAFDKENNSFVIIEYKRGKSFSVIDQGYSYLALMLNNKSDFILEYNEKTNSNLKRGNVDWSQSKVIFIANSFTPYQMNAINFQDLPMELWEVKMYDSGIILYNRLLSQNSRESIRSITRNEVINRVNNEVKVYTIDDHLHVNENVKDLFFVLKEKILSLSDSVEERVKQNYVSYRLKNAFVYIHTQQSQIKIHLAINKKDLDDPRNISRDVTNIGHHGGGETEVILKKLDDLNYIFRLVEQAYYRLVNKR